VSDARSVVLQRIRTALDDRGAGVAPTSETPPPGMAPGPSDATADSAVAAQAAEPAEPAFDIVERFAERVADYRAHVATGEDVRALVAAACERHGVRRLAVPEGVPPAWLPDGLELAAVPSPPAPPDIAALDAVDGVLTGCATAIAETGTIVLDGGPGQGPRAATLLPDLHICVVAQERIVAGVRDAVEHLAHDVGRPVTFISGPSATSDIELERVEGVHGPRRLEVIVAR
jgi:L-lactate dehydrogenase complex protein LldG